MLNLYVLIRDDMSSAQQAVQAGHAVAQFGLDHPQEFREWQGDSNTLIYLSVKSARVHYWMRALSDGKFKHSVFFEEDKSIMNYAGYYYADDDPIPTAIAVAPNWTCQYLLFKDLPLAFQPKPKETHPVHVTPSPGVPLATGGLVRTQDEKKHWWQR